MYFLLEKNKKGGFFTMIKNRRTSGLLSMALATCLVVSAVPVQTVDSILGNAAGRVTAYAEETAQSTKPLTTLWKTQEVGTHEGTGTYAYDAAGATDKREREEKAADRIFGLLPKDQGIYFRELWEEFEAYETADAKYAHLLDNFQPVLLNDASGGKSWAEHGVKSHRFIREMKKWKRHQNQCGR